MTLSPRGECHDDLQAVIIAVLTIKGRKQFILCEMSKLYESLTISDTSIDHLLCSNNNT